MVGRNQKTPVFQVYTEQKKIRSVFYMARLHSPGKFTQSVLSSLVAFIFKGPHLVWSEAAKRIRNDEARIVRNWNGECPNVRFVQRLRIWEGTSRQRCRIFRLQFLKILSAILFQSDKKYSSLNGNLHQTLQTTKNW